MKNEEKIQQAYLRLIEELMKDEDNKKDLEEDYIEEDDIEECYENCDKCSKCYKENETLKFDDPMNDTIYISKNITSKEKLPKKVLFFTSAGMEKTDEESLDIAMNKAKMFEAKSISCSNFIQIDKDCEIKNSFTGATLEDSVIYGDSYSSNYLQGIEVEIFNTIGILELKDRKSENKFIFVKTLKNTKNEDDLKTFNEIERIENYLMNIYNKAFINDFELINTHIASESIELDKYPKTKPVILSGIQLIN